MKNVQTSRNRKKFGLLASTRAAQAAVMSLSPGESSSDDIANEHPKSEQWLLVLAGRGTATVIGRAARRHDALRPGSLLVIQRFERHQIRNPYRTTLRTVNFYVPPAYDRAGHPLSPRRLQS
jgi:mannose-6-phosphate isomerase-like protein (cupin superfamily)